MENLYITKNDVNGQAILDALKAYEDARHNWVRFPRIVVYSDGSGHVTEGVGEDELFAFDGLEDLVDRLHVLAGTPKVVTVEQVLAALREYADAHGEDLPKVTFNADGSGLVRTVDGPKLVFTSPAEALKLIETA